ncbi:hypothetical protein TorRG33x02_279180 [Trema orientale]|uniref:Uncharacterized protein n=1 Tax=Trema orientale TaxID=63057 RepID=A0A2P5CMZ4_TREOI|nr:hypothetical protein TorRG33x02_279180 [Trema orientale]
MHKNTLVQYFLLNHTAATLNGSTSSFSLLRSCSTLAILASICCTASCSQLQPAASLSSQLSHSSFSAVSLGQTQAGAPLYSHCLDHPFTRSPAFSLGCSRSLIYPLTRLLTSAPLHFVPRPLSSSLSARSRPSSLSSVSHSLTHPVSHSLTHRLVRSPAQPLSLPLSLSHSRALCLSVSLVQSFSSLSRSLGGLQALVLELHSLSGRQATFPQPYSLGCRLSREELSRRLGQSFSPIHSPSLDHQHTKERISLFL